MHLYKLSLVFFIIFLSACSSIGPKEVQLDRGSYNEIARDTDAQQTLTNIIYLAYQEPTYSLEITNVTASSSLTRNINGSTTLTTPNTAPSSDLARTTHTFGLGAAVTYTDAPTVSYKPLDSRSLVSLMQTPISFENILALSNGNTENIEEYARLLFSHVGPLNNANSLSNPLVTDQVLYKNFYQFLQIFSKLIHSYSATFKPVIYKDHVAFEYKFKPGIGNTPDAITMKKLLQIPLNSENFILVDESITPATMDSLGRSHKMVAENIPIVSMDNNGTLTTKTSAPEPTNLVKVQTRTVYGVMSYLSHAVDIPNSDLSADYTQKILNNQHDYFDFKPLLHNLMAIYSSNTEPKDTFVKVYVKGHWFYIKESDIYSKATLSLLMRLMIIVGGMDSHQDDGPQLTIAVGAGTNAG